MGSALLEELEETLLTAGFSFRLQKMFFVCILGIKISRWLRETLMCSFLIMNHDFFFFVLPQLLEKEKES